MHGEIKLIRRDQSWFSPGTDILFCGNGISDVLLMAGIRVKACDNVLCVTYDTVPHGLMVEAYCPGSMYRLQVGVRTDSNIGNNFLLRYETGCALAARGFTGYPLYLQFELSEE